MLQTVRYRAILLAISSLLAIALGFWLIPARPAVRLMQHGGYFLVLATSIAFGFVLWRTLTASGFRKLWSRADVFLAATCLAIVFLWQIHGIHGFKILMDELVLAATAMSMHFDREAFVPIKTHFVDGQYITLAGIVDKRPLFFPFLVSVLHDIFGYRPGNVFALNAVLSLILLFLVGRFGRRLGGQPMAGHLAVILLGGLPLLALNATGGGFEVLNLVMILVVAALARRYLEQPGERTLDALILGTVLLAQTRYESVLFVPFVGIIVLLGWWRLRHPLVSWGLFAGPLLLLPVPLLQRLFAVNKGNWQLPEGAESAFGIRYVFDNIGGAVEFLFTVDSIKLGSPILSLAGVVCLAFLVVYVVRRARSMVKDPLLLPFSLFTVTVLANFALLLCYHWGQLQDFVASRLGLPLLIWFALCAAFGIGRWVRRQEAWIPILGIPAAWFLFGSLPAHVKSDDLNGFLSYQEVKWQREFIGALKGSSRDLFVMPSSLPAILERRPALTIVALAERAEQLLYHLNAKTYDNVWVFERYAIDPDQGIKIPDKRSALGPEFVREIVAERRFTPFYMMRLSRISDVDVALRPPRPEDWKPQFPPFHIPEAGTDASVEERYVQKYLNELP